MSHTPGPWEHGDGHVKSSNDQSIAIVSARQSAGFMELTPECYDNARLIAAAPELLEALQALWDFLEDLGDSNPGFMSKLCLQDYGAMNEAYMKTRAALTKAKGEVL